MQLLRLSLERPDLRLQQMQSHFQEVNPPSPPTHTRTHTLIHTNTNKKETQIISLYPYFPYSSLIFKLKIRLEERVINILPFFFLFRLLQDLLLSKGQFNRVGELLLSPSASAPPLCVPPHSTSSITEITWRCFVPLEPRNKKKKKIGLEFRSLQPDRPVWM